MFTSIPFNRMPIQPADTEVPMNGREKPDDMPEKNQAPHAAAALSEMLRITRDLLQSGIMERVVIEGGKPPEMPRTD